MNNLLLRESKFPGENFEPGPELKELFEENAQVLVVGAGGLGCEILKNLALCNVNNIFVVDLDTIELSNLNRQFLFREKDIGKYKSQVACEYIKNKYPNINIQYSTKKIQEFTDDFFRQFLLIIGGLDNLEARRYINEKVHDLVEFDENGNVIPGTVIPYIDGGTEGFRGQTRVIIPYKTACFSCTDNLINNNRNTFALCTIAETPRIPEHCIEYAFIIEWKKHFNKGVDADNIDDVNWIYQTALKRAENFGIEGVTYNLTLGVIKNIIPAISSTNALIAANTCMEAIKVITGASQRLDNYFMYMGHEGLYSSNEVMEKNPDCKVCNKHVHLITVEKGDLFKGVLDKIKEKFKLSENYEILNGIKFLHAAGKSQENYEYLNEKIIENLCNDKELNMDKILLIINRDSDVNEEFKVRLTYPKKDEE
jgi:ubiquitin-activating enzyme E1 C